MAGYSGTPLWKKLGYRDGLVAWVKNGPANYVSLLNLPRDLSVTWIARPKRGIGFVHLFATARSELEKNLRLLWEQLDRAGTVWVSWPKKSAGVSTDITEDVIRQVALPLGFVDIKVCAVDETWSGLKLVIRKELR
ncbi:MAG TPA: DUF3052 domain-containing protein [Chthoniobacterales bacterium]|jgi:hypothetical protein|nr:DUF3052 domain-containing protein [Chthoniobacterales bacterium]